MIFVRYLYLNDVTLKLLQHHQRFTSDQFGIQDEDIDLSLSFPRIELLSVAANQNNFSFSESDVSDVLSNTLHVEIFKSIALDTLQDRCFSFLGGRKCRTLCLFGMEIGNPNAERRPLHASGISSLVVRDGASIDMPSLELADVFKTNSFELPSTTEFAISLQQTEPDASSASLLQLILETAKRKTQCDMNLRNIHTPAPVLKVRCYPSMLEPLVRAVSS